MHPDNDEWLGHMLAPLRPGAGPLRGQRRKLGETRRIQLEHNRLEEVDGRHDGQCDRARLGIGGGRVRCFGRSSKDTLAWREPGNAT